ncbi:MAG: kynureninase, partial [Alphaproteobacteria bacterium]
SVNLFKLLTAALELRPGRRVVVSEEENFPTDLYIAQGLCRMLGQGHELRFCDPEDVAASLDDRVAVAMLTHVNYRSGRMHDMAAVTDAVHDRGALMLWDLAHSAGAMPVDLDGCGVDLAVGCGYKFLNGGPGAPAFLYVAERHQDRIAPVLSGWMGHVAPFEFVRDYRPAAGIQRQLCGTPPVLSMAALEVAVDQMLRADMALVRQKSVTLAGTFMDLVAQECAGLGFGILSPRSDARRGSQVCLTHEHGYPIMQALIAAGVIGDFRSPDVLRFGLTPLYLRHVDMWDAVATLKEIMDEGAWERPEYHLRARVT